MTLGSIRPSDPPPASVVASQADPVKKSVVHDVEPVTVTMIGTGTTSGGGVAPTPDGTVLVTPDGQPNIIANVVPPVIAILVRAINTWLTVFSSLSTAAGVFGSKVLGTSDLKSALTAAALAATIAAAGATIKNLITVFGRMEGKYPLSTGTI